MKVGKIDSWLSISDIGIFHTNFFPNNYREEGERINYILKQGVGRYVCGAKSENIFNMVNEYDKALQQLNEEKLNGDTNN